MKGFIYDKVVKVYLMKTAKLQDDTHHNITLFKIENKLKSISAAIDKLLEDKEWRA